MHAQQTELAARGYELFREDALFEPIGDTRQDAIANERAHRIADQTLIFGERCVQVEKIDRIEGTVCGDHGYLLSTRAILSKSAWMLRSCASSIRRHIMRPSVSDKLAVIRCVISTFLPSP